jgi:uncharacterized protein
MAKYQLVGREIVWKGTRNPSLDYCSVRKEKEGWRFVGIMVAKSQANPFGVRYEVLVDRTFKTRSLAVEKTSGGKSANIKVDFLDGIWLVDGQERTDLRQCSDVDIEASPVTNTIPIRRNHLKVGQRVDLTASWVRFPSLDVTSLKQSYERLGPRKYLYQSASGFTAEIEVDNFGLVTRYGGIWEEVR